MTEIPDGYMLWMVGGRQELITPRGERIPVPYHATLEQIVEEARVDKAINTVCQWDPGCPVCEERRERKGLAA